MESLFGVLLRVINMEVFRNLPMESFLQCRSSRERVLLFGLCFLLGFALVVVLLGGLQGKLQEERERNAELNHALFALQNTLVTQRNLKEEDTEKIHKKIIAIEQKISQQEEQKRLISEKFGVYFLKELADVNALYSVEIMQENGEIHFSAYGKYAAMLGFLESLQTQPKISLFAMQLYPNPSAMDLVLFATLHIQGQ